MLQPAMSSFERAELMFVLAYRKAGEQYGKEQCESAGSDVSSSALR